MGTLKDHGRKWIEDLYWKHFRSIKFLQRLCSGFEDKLALPMKFGNNLRNILPQNVVLKGPGGCTWCVGLRAKKGTLFFKDGWRKFVMDHSLQNGDMLLFTYSVGNSQFDVSVFDTKTQCEKEASYFVISSRESGDIADGSRRGALNNHRVNAKCVEDVYWTNFRSIYFLVGFTEEFVLPSKFCHKMRENVLSEMAILKGPSGSAWNVRLFRNDDRVLLKDGWQEFAKCHSLEFSDLLIFRYNVGTSCFDVLVFDGESMCEKEATYLAGECVNPEDLIVFSAKRKMQEISSQEAPFSEENGCSSPIHPSNSGLKITASQKFLSKRTNTNSATRQTSSPAGKLKPRAVINEETEMPGKKTIRIDSKKDKALQAANVEATEDSFVVVIRPSYIRINFCLVVPARWLNSHFHGRVKAEVVLHVGEREWRCILKRPPSGGSGLLTSGWKNFAVENKLRLCDVCLFKPVQGTIREPIRFEVSIFRSGKDKEEVIQSMKHE
ncbi:hypothetical protein K2173_007331 [Erythroxylum novogranatense]|uniref:TF-B3 domain-containing protein n=1 Tax=Erythroxylum novogranatense TaxID=1862640 RepID=A0AAV8T5W7_9ROSI|nr:hypothetical protein K2173_007331 [Erythroxylum novogranatense]